MKRLVTEKAPFRSILNLESKLILRFVLRFGYS